MMNIVPMAERHIRPIAEIEKLCFSDPWSENSIATELNNRLSFWLVAEVDGVVAGYVGSQSVLGESDVMNVAVTPDFRKQGIGEALMRGLMKELKARGNRCLTLEVRVSNEPAIKLYEKLGFLQVGRRPNYYRNPKEDALILRKEYDA